MLTMASLASLVLLISAPSMAQSTPAKNTPSAAKVVAPPSEKSSQAQAAQPRTNGATDGIKVHGHWTIEVRNPDGTLVTHHEFENAYVPKGFLPLILGRQNSVGTWMLVLSGSLTPPCFTTGPVACYIFETGVTVPANYAGSNASATMSVGSGIGALVLSGTVTAGENGEIDQVASDNWLCAPSISPSACIPVTNGSVYPFTMATLGSAINVSIGQTVAVTVSFTFA
jgi:hypothetical protein